MLSQVVEYFSQTLISFWVFLVSAGKSIFLVNKINGFNLGLYEC